MPSNEEIENETKRIAKMHGCDRAVFTVCWAEYEGRGECRCKADAITSLSKIDLLIRGGSTRMNELLQLGTPWYMWYIIAIDIPIVAMMSLGLFNMPAHPRFTESRYDAETWAREDE
jgi:hypothetical protein